MDGSDHDPSELPFHRWLPVRGQAAIQKTPIAQTERRLWRWVVELGHSCTTLFLLR
jgi:hypothetical protein